jgi:hypothetical protein
MRWSWKRLGSHVCHHVDGGAVQKAHYSVGYALAKRVHAVVDVLGALAVHGIL